MLNPYLCLPPQADVEALARRVDGNTEDLKELASETCRQTDEIAKSMSSLSKARGPTLRARILRRLFPCPLPSRRSRLVSFVPLFALPLAFAPMCPRRGRASSVFRSAALFFF